MGRQNYTLNRHHPVYQENLSNSGDVSKGSILRW